ncbi:restriction endonuclease subunit S [Lactococcus cremoris]|uniref:restriction endonuclease subunit S n=1 Tax=Lactococcus lactis subsp. cremoris TaxID=1359 RepID=UPI00218215A6|nr:restriction endonuclease subunit S [Lactococcus cremoris]
MVGTMAKIDDSVKKKVPELRFPGFTDDWEERKLGEHSNILTGGTPKTSMSNYWNPKEIPWMSSGEVNKRRLNETDNMISKEGLENSSARWVKENSIVIALAGQGKTRGTVAVNNIPLTTNQSIAAIEPYETLNFEFIFQNLSKRYDELRMMSSGDGTRGGLNKKIIYDIIITAPILEEQQKIGSFFKQLDNTIALHQRKLDLLKEQKKGYLQKMFPKNGAKVPELRFAGFADDWEERKLGDITKISTGKLDANAMVENGKYDFYTSGIKKYRIDVAAFEGPSITIAGNGATVGYMHLADNKFNAYQRTYVLQEFLVDRSFIFSEIGNKLPKKIKQEARTGNIPYIVMDMLTELKLSIPQNNSEQQKIGSFFKQLDDTIDLHQRKLDLLKEQKKGFLQKMFV